MTQAPVFQAAVRHANGQSNLFHVQAPHILNHEQAIEEVRQGVPTAKVILCNVHADPVESEGGEVA